MEDKVLETWGILASLDIHDCDPDKIRDAEYIKQYVIDLCELIDMKRFGETQVVNFGDNDKVAGYSMVQLIETSCITGHFANLTNRAYIDVFSCKYFNPKEVQAFSEEYFTGIYSKLTVTLRD
jgi:S-adenosylmethionine/arginine decarboxylase-like enzyme